MSQRTEAQCIAPRKDTASEPGIMLFIPAHDLAELFEALELAADRGDFARVDRLLVKLDRAIQAAAGRGETWAKDVMSRLDDADPSGPTAPAPALAAAAR